MKGTIILSLILTIAFSCKNDKKAEEIKESFKLNENKEYFSLTINAIIEYNDEFKLFYLEENEKAITKKNSVSVLVEGNILPQELKFQITKDIIPTKLVLMFGNDERHQKVQFVDAKLNYYDKEIFIEKERFYQFFIPNEFIEYNQEEYTAIANEKNGNYNPAFFSREILENKIDITFY